jgi:hypothetical protein
MQRTTSPNRTSESVRARVTAHRLGGGDDLDTAWRSRTYTATSMTPRTRLYGASQKSSAATIDGTTKKNHISDETLTAKLSPPIHAVQITTDRGLRSPGIGASSVRPAPTVTRPTATSSRNVTMRAACTTPPTLGRRPGRAVHNAGYRTARRMARFRWSGKHVPQMSSGPSGSQKYGSSEPSSPRRVQVGTMTPLGPFPRRLTSTLECRVEPAFSNPRSGAIPAVQLPVCFTTCARADLGRTL